MGVMILALDPDMESDFQSFDDSGPGSSKKWNHNNSNQVRPVAGGLRCRGLNSSSMVGEVEGEKRVKV